jgi:hypothetical protein
VPIGKDFTTAIVQKHNVEIAWSIAGHYSTPDGVVGVHPLTRGGARESLEQDLKVLEPGNHFLDARNGNQSIRQGQTHAPIAFGFDNAYASSFGD